MHNFINDLNDVESWTVEFEDLFAIFESHGQAEYVQDDYDRFNALAREVGEEATKIGVEAARKGEDMQVQAQLFYSAVEDYLIAEGKLKTDAKRYVFG